jgi:hypothetical protein
MMFFGLILAENKLSAIEIGIATLGSERPDAYAALLNWVLSDKCAQVSVLQQPQSVTLRRGRATQ